MLARSKSVLSKQLRDGTAPLGDVFAWLSALYFRGKLLYANRFTSVEHGVLVMTPGAGLRPPTALISAADLRTMGKIDIESSKFTKPLRRDAEQANELFGNGTRVVLLGSIATGKYVDTLLDVFGDRLQFPETFVGRGDMSRGGLMLRASRSGEELAYCPVAGAKRHGQRPAKLPRVVASSRS